MQQTLRPSEILSFSGLTKQTLGLGCVRRGGPTFVSRVVPRENMA